MNLNKVLPYISNYQKPCLIYDLEAIQQKMTFFSDLAVEHKNLYFLFAVKSFPEEVILQLASKNMNGFEISNRNEYSLLPLGLRNKKISVNDPTQGFNLFIPKSQHKKNEFYFHLNDIFFYSTRKRFIAQKNHYYGIRISHTGLSDNKHQDNFSRFGVTLDYIIEHKNKLDINKIIGFHIHNGSEKNTIDTYLEMLQKILFLIKKNDLTIHFINFGGGLHNISLSQISELSQLIINKVSKFHIQCIFEPGNVISNSCGLALGKIMNITNGHDISPNVTLDLSAECHLKWSTPSLLMAATQIIEKNDNTKEIVIGGPTCFERDIIGKFKVKLEENEMPFSIGDILCFGNINGYSSAWNIAFNGIEKADVYFI